MAVNQMTLIPPDRSIPEEVRWDFINCAVDTSLQYYTPTELQRLNAHASGAKFMTDDELNAIDARLRTRVESEGGLEWLMNKSCPETMQQIAAAKG